MGVSNALVDDKIKNPIERGETHMHKQTFNTLKKKDNETKKNQEMKEPETFKKQRIVGGRPNGECIARIQSNN